MKIITCEQVSNGHPDKICDQIADAIVTDCLQHDKNSRVAIEVLIKDSHIIIAGELTALIGMMKELRTEIKTTEGDFLLWQSISERGSSLSIAGDGTRTRPMKCCPLCWRRLAATAKPEGCSFRYGNH